MSLTVAECVPALAVVAAWLEAVSKSAGKLTPAVINIGRLSPAFPVTPPDMRVRIRRFGGLSYRPAVNLGIPSESK